MNASPDGNPPGPSGVVFEVTFERSGLHPYACYLHVGMIGVVAVGDANAKADDAIVTGAPTGTRSDAEPVAAGGELPPEGDRSSSGWWLAGLAGMVGLATGPGLAAAIRNVRTRMV
jgi:hypothetical protein